MLFGSGPPDCRLQNTSTDGFIKMAILLVWRLCARGVLPTNPDAPFSKKWATSSCSLLLTQAACSFQRWPTLPVLLPRHTEPTHLPFTNHPWGITWQQFWAAYSATIEQLIPAQYLIVAVVSSRPQNIKDRVCRTDIPSTQRDNPSHYIETGDNIMSPQIFPWRWAWPLRWPPS
jgi:hypothetical protein